MMKLDAKYKQQFNFPFGNLGKTPSQLAYQRFKRIQAKYGNDLLYHDDGFKMDRHGNIFTNSFIITKEGKVIYSDNEAEFTKARKRYKFASGGKVPTNSHGKTLGEPSTEIDVTLHGGEQIVNADATKTNARLLAAINKYGARLINPDGSINSVYHKLFGFKSAKDFDAKKTAKGVGNEIKAGVAEETSTLISNILKGLKPANHKAEDLAYIVDVKQPTTKRLAKALDLFRKEQTISAKADPKAYGKMLAKSGIGHINDKFNSWLDTDGTGVNVEIKNSLIDTAMKLGGNVRKKALEGASNAAFAAKHKLLDRTSTLNNIRTLAGNDVESSVMDKSRDIYMEGVKSPVLTTFKFSQRAYVDQATGAIIKRPSEITGTVVDTRGNVVLTLNTSSITTLLVVMFCDL
jgi:hypothetical protein